MLDVSQIREDFPILKRKVNGYPLIYLDNAATTQKPLQVIDAIREFYEEHNANVHRAVHTLSQEASELYETAHEEVARFIGATSMKEIVFVKNTTEAINLVAYSLGLSRLGKGDEVVVTLMDHHSNIVPWIMLGELRGFKVKFAGVNSDGSLNHDDLERLVSKRTRIVCLPHMSNVTGAVNNIEQLAKFAHDHGAMVIVDGAQSVPRMLVDVRRLGIDFLAFSGHKMLGPTGIGVLYGREDLMKEMSPFLAGGDMVKKVKFDAKGGCCSIVWNELPWRFEAGTPNVCGGVGLMAAVKYLRALGMENVDKHEKMLTEYALRRFSTLTKTRIYGPASTQMRGGIIPFNMDGVNSHDVSLFLDQYGVMIRSGFHCAQPLHEQLGIGASARASFYVYNTLKEIDRLVELLAELEKI